MSRVTATFADVAKEGPAALLKAAPAPEGDAVARPLERLLPGALVEATVENSAKYCTVLKYHPADEATSSGTFELKEWNGTSAYVGEKAIPACDVSFLCVRDASVDPSKLREFKEIDASRALGLMMDEVNGMEWDGMGWDGMGWDGMERNGME